MCQLHKTIEMCCLLFSLLCAQQKSKNRKDRYMLKKTKKPAEKDKIKHCLLTSLNMQCILFVECFINKLIGNGE